MPYIHVYDRADNTAVRINTALPESLRLANAGELNFAITSLIDEYLGRTGIRYQNINTVIGVLECAKLEVYRRVAVPYEDKKCKENGDVYYCLHDTEYNTREEL